MPPRFYCPQPLSIGPQNALPEAVAHHAKQVLRLPDGAPVTLFNGIEGEYQGFLQYQGTKVYATLSTHEKDNRQPPLTIHLLQGLATGDKMDWVIQKAGEMGVRSVRPIAAERSVLKLSGERAERRVNHWQQVAIAAAEQCGCNRPLEVTPIQNLAHCFADLRTRKPGDEIWIFDQDEGTPLSQCTQPTGDIYVMIGPEGGWSPAELAQAAAAGCRRVKMGPRILRTESAGLAVAAALLTRWGDF